MKAGLAISRQLRDPDDTGQVFKIPGSAWRLVERLGGRADDRGQLAKCAKSIIDKLNDRKPAGDAGRLHWPRLLRFRHREGLSADGLIASAKRLLRSIRLAITSDGSAIGLGIFTTYSM